MTKLRVVAADETPEPQVALSLAEAVETGDYYKILVAQRREIAQNLPEERGPAKAALHRQLSLIAKEIEALELRAKQERSEGVEAASSEAWDSEAI